MKVFNLRKKKKYQVRIYVSVLAFLLLNLTVIQESSAQESTKEGNIYGGLGYFAVGYSKIKIDALNESLQKEGFSAAPTEFITFGGGGHGIIGNVIIGGEGHSMSSKSSTIDDGGKPVESSLDGGYGFMNIGYVALSKKALLLYPMLGIGGGGMRLKLSDAPQATNFPAILKNYQHSVELDNGGFLLNFQLAADFVMSGNAQGRGGLLLGIHAGYLYAPAKWNWSWDGVGLADGPNVNLNGPNVRLTLGGGGYGRMKIR